MNICVIHIGVIANTLTCTWIRFRDLGEMAEKRQWRKDNEQVANEMSGEKFAHNGEWNEIS